VRIALPIIAHPHGPDTCAFPHASRVNCSELMAVSGAPRDARGACASPCDGLSVAEAADDAARLVEPPLDRVGVVQVVGGVAAEYGTRDMVGELNDARGTGVDEEGNLAEGSQLVPLSIILLAEARDHGLQAVFV
jgi:hypothetical protein